MSQTFQTLGVSAPARARLAKHEITIPFAIQRLVVPDALAGRDILAQSPTGSGKTLAFGHAARRARCDPAAASPPRSCSSRPASSRPRSRPTSGRWPPPRACASARSTAAKSVDPQARAGTRRPHILDRHAGSPQRSARAEARSRSMACAHSSSTRQTACSTWASSRRSTASCAASRTSPADNALLGHARRSGRRAGGQVHEGAVALPRRTAGRKSNT